MHRLTLCLADGAGVSSGPLLGCTGEVGVISLSLRGMSLVTAMFAVFPNLKLDKRCFAQ